MGDNDPPSDSPPVPRQNPIRVQSGEFRLNSILLFWVNQQGKTPNGQTCPPSLSLTPQIRNSDPTENVSSEKAAGSRLSHICHTYGSRTQNSSYSLGKRARGLKKRRLNPTIHSWFESSCSSLRDASQCANPLSAPQASSYRPQGAARRSETYREHSKTRRISRFGPGRHRPTGSPPTRAAP